MANVLRVVLAELGLAALTLAVTAAPALAQTTTLTMSSWVSPQHHLTSTVLQGWANEVEKATNGRVKFTMLPMCSPEILVRSAPAAGSRRPRPRASTRPRSSPSSAPS